MEKRELLAVAESPIFKNIDINQLNRVLNSHQPIIKWFKKGETVWFQSQVLDKLIIVIDGKLKAQMASDDGKIINMEEFGKYQPVAIPVLFSKNQKLPVTLFAKEDSQVFLLPKEMLLSCCMANQDILENTLSVMSKKVDFLSKKINFLQLNNIKQKIATILLQESKKVNSKSFILSKTKEELSKEMAVTRPSLSREFKNLITQGIIKQDKEYITILDYTLLKEYR